LRVAQEFELAGFLPEAVVPQRSDHLVHGLSGRLVLVKEVAAEKYHVDIAGARNLHNLIKGAPAVILSDRVSLFVAHMVVGRDQYADCIFVYGMSE